MARQALGEQPPEAVEAPGEPDAPPRRGWRCGVAKPFSILAIAEAEGRESSLAPSAQAKGTWATAC